MSEIRPAQITNNPFSTWANSVQDKISQQDISTSSDFNIKAGPAGKFLSIKSNIRYKPYYMNYRGNWDATAAYTVNDVVRVLPNQNYIGYPSLSGSFTGSIPWYNSPPDLQLIGGGILGSNQTLYGAVAFPNPLPGGGPGSEIIFPLLIGYYVPIPGTYICVSNVPSLINQLILIFNVQKTSNLGIAFITSQATNLTNFQLANINYIRLSDVNYFPTWPEMPNVAIVNPYNLTLTNGRYWELLSLAPSSLIGCGPNGQPVAQLMDSTAYPSGSANYTGSFSTL